MTCTYCHKEHDPRVACPEQMRMQINRSRAAGSFANPDEPFDIKRNMEMQMVRLLGGPFEGEVFERPKGEPHFKVTRQYSHMDRSFSYAAFSDGAVNVEMGQELYRVERMVVGGHTIYFGLHDSTTNMLDGINAMWKSHVWAIHGEDG